MRPGCVSWSWPLAGRARRRSPTDRSKTVSREVARLHDGDVADASFDELMGMLDYPVFVVTAQADGHPSGCLVSFATQASVQPPRFLVNLSRSSHTFGVASRSEYLAVHVLSQRHRLLAESGTGTDLPVGQHFEQWPARGPRAKLQPLSHHPGRPRFLQ